MATPSEELTNIIFGKLVQEELLSEEDVRKLLSKASAGKMTSADWRLAIEKSLEKEGADE